MRRLTLAVCLLAVTGCAANNPLAPSVSLDAEFTVAQGAAVSVQGTSLRLQFQAVTGDSRCPSDVFCITGGDAVVQIRASGYGTPVVLELHTGDSARATAIYGSLRVTLVSLQPYPFSGRTIEQGEYRATLRVARA
jgi:hypothetical protein